MTQGGYVVSCVVVGMFWGKLIEIPCLFVRDRIMPPRLGGIQRPSATIPILGSNDGALVVIDADDSTKKCNSQ